MAVGMSKQYEVIISVREKYPNPAAMPCAIKFDVPSVYADRYYWRDAHIMMQLAQKVLMNFANVYLKAVK